MRRGDIAGVALQGDYGKPRPALIIHSDLFDAHPSVTVLPITSDLRPTPLFRIALDPSEGNGLRKPSQVMIDKAQTIARDKVGEIFGRLEDAKIVEVNRALAVFLGLG